MKHKCSKAPQSAGPLKFYPVCVGAEPINGKRIGRIAEKLARLCLPISFFYDANVAQRAARIKASYAEYETVNCIFRDTATR